ncbi:hypothetical protein BC939DRAFT_256025 [Gamsiella multidivaricata]|uniref:uncharacterized protein n=1 Tax=Gamsiella multidivaricata TaxID=101098 RepID=UPI00222033D0|nr:uncharacterized protein BC939DRAFT_256025 [Gamsiella multidivaricata]KAI7830582.1 hypothetical protein BC939DRAFT_256025 [Gamsiella multidivaricata]
MNPIPILFLLCLLPLLEKPSKHPNKVDKEILPIATAGKEQQRPRFLPLFQNTADKEHYPNKLDCHYQHYQLSIGGTRTTDLSSFLSSFFSSTACIHPAPSFLDSTNN